MAKINQFISIVAYVHNDADNIINFIRTVMLQCDNFKQHEFVFVDDYSMDNSVNVIKDYFEKNPCDYIVSIIHMGYYQGMEIAMNAGRDMAIGDFVYEFDSLYVDFGDNIMMDVYNKCLEGNDIVSAVTKVPIKLTSRLFYNIFNHTMNSQKNIGQDSFRVLSRRGINRIISMDVNIPYRKVIYQNCGLSTAFVKYKSTTGKRPPRLTKKHERVDLAIDSFIYFTHFFQHFTLASAVGFGLFFLVIFTYALISRSLGYHIGQGWLSVITALSVGFSGLFGILTVIIRYLSVIVDLVFKQQKYRISDIEKISLK